jgi:triosephosphate isomerase
MKPLIVANWKANKTISETIDWINQTKTGLESAANIEIVICPPFTAIPATVTLLTNSSVKVGAQNVSNQTSGAFTGEVSAQLLTGLVSHCIVGHSERRRYYSETDSQVVEKVDQLLANNIIPVLCVSDPGQMDSYLSLSDSFRQDCKKIVFVYEPPGAISGGGNYHPESPEEASANATKISEKIGEEVFTLYGGSVSEADVAKFLNAKNISGVLVGKASLSPETFLSLVKKANQVMV